MVATQFNGHKKWDFELPPMFDCIRLPNLLQDHAGSSEGPALTTTHE
jgi:hypothetical protein